MSTNIPPVSQKVENAFNDIESNIFSGDMFSQWRGSFEVKKAYIKKENADIKCDLDIRLAHWPDGVFVKVYKHKALAALPYVKDPQVCKDHLGTEPIPCKFWKDSFYFSHLKNLDQDRYVLLEGNDMSDDDSKTCLNKLIVEINDIVKID